ncbi:hypothetical protein ACSDQ9_06310 [Aestuariimicrobium soli]|uniref:hypothetical protein n=1 Tax=Aestuariimicrobium soli TaxID=2035834 RepID=UPI003EC092CF
MRLLTPATAAAHGVTRHQLLGPRFRRIFQGVYVDADVAPTLSVLVAAARLVVPGATVTGVTALRLRGASLGADSPVCLATTQRVRRDGITCVHRPATTPIASLVEALDDADLRLTDEVVTLDELRRLGMVRRTEADDLAAHRPHTWALSVPTSGSVRESRTRMLLITAGLPEPVVQFTVVSSSGRFVGRVDLALRAGGWRGRPPMLGAAWLAEVA